MRSISPRIRRAYPGFAPGLAARLGGLFLAACFAWPAGGADAPRVYSIRWDRAEQPPVECFVLEWGGEMTTFVAPDAWGVRPLPGEGGLAVVPTNLVAAITVRFMALPAGDEFQRARDEFLRQGIEQRHPGARIKAGPARYAGKLQGRTLDFQTEVQPGIKAAFRLVVFVLESALLEVELRAPADRLGEFDPVLTRFLANLWAGRPPGPWPGFPRSPEETAR